MRRFSPARIAGGAVAAAVSLLLLAGCATDPLAEQYKDGTDTNYISGDGVYKEYAADDRQDPVEFEGVSDAGVDISSADYADEVYVVNFWYASCPPCRAEAADLQQLSVDYADKGVDFLGVNTYDQAGLRPHLRHHLPVDPRRKRRRRAVRVLQVRCAERGSDHPGDRPRGPRRRTLVGHDQ
jgi:thiol-disulfide isomerase/thioredoxin